MLGGHIIYMYTNMQLTTSCQIEVIMSMIMFNGDQNQFVHEISTHKLSFRHS